MGLDPETDSEEDLEEALLEQKENSRSTATNEPTTTKITMSNNTEERQFAFGENSYDGCPCPLTAAGYNPDNSPYLLIAERYDELVGGRLDIDYGKVPENIAKEAWLKVIEEYDDQMHRGDQNKREIAREVAAELGWLNDE